MSISPSPWFVQPISGTSGFDVVDQRGRIVMRYGSFDDATFIAQAPALLMFLEYVILPTLTGPNKSAAQALVNKAHGRS